jgi:hypothetical protein
MVVNGVNSSDDAIPASNIPIEIQNSKHDAVLSSTEPDPLPLTEILPLAGLGLIVPSSDYDQNLYCPVERIESNTLKNLTFIYKRILGGINTEDAATGITDVKFFDTNDVVDDWEISDVNVCAMLEGSESTGSCYIGVKRVTVAETDEPLLVDVSIVYTDDSVMDFDMGSGYVSLLMPESVCKTYNSNIYFCTKYEGSGKIASDAAAELAARSANDGIQKQLDEDGSVNEINSENDYDPNDDVSVSASMTREEMLLAEEEREERLREEEERLRETEEEEMKNNALVELQDSIDGLEAERSNLTKEHAELQRKLAAYIALQKRRDNSEQQRNNEKESMPAHELEKQYNDTLTNIVTMEEKLNNQKSEFDKIAIDLQTRLDEKECKANEIAVAFRDFKREISRGSENSRTGKPMSKKTIEDFEQAEIKKDEEAERVRLKNINLKMTLKKLENNLRAKEQLAEGLHLIDFEQLKIENQTLNEKIEERNEELHKLRKKNTTTVQVLTHIKEKLQAVQANNGVVREQLGSLDSQLSAARDKLNRHKREREVVRKENAILRQKQGFANSTLLVVDYATRKTKLQETRSQLAELMERYDILMTMAQGAGGNSQTSGGQGGATGGAGMPQGQASMEGAGAMGGLSGGSAIQ